MANTTIRDYQPADWEATLDMIVQTVEYHISIQRPRRFKTYTMSLLRNFLRGLAKKQKSGTGKFLVAVDETDKPIGFIYGSVDRPSRELARNIVKSGSVDELFVVPASRGQKVAQQLMAKMEEYFAQNDCTLVRLKEVHTTNSPAQKLYTKLGYQSRLIEFAKEI